MIVALAGRRIDAEDADTPRFPLRNVSLVRERIHSAFKKHEASGLVCAAACGADLIALEVAGDLGLRRRIVLPFPKELFRQKSVVDRPGEWGELFDRIVAAIKPGDLTVLEDKETEEAFLKGNEGILQSALELARETHKPAGAFVVWDGAPRDATDITDDFRRRAASRSLPVTEIKTT